MLSRTLRLAKQTRFLSSGRILREQTPTPTKTATKLSEVTGPNESLIGPGAKPGTIPTQLDQATGLERFELLGKQEGIDVFDTENPIFEGSGTPTDPYLVPTYVGYRYVGCAGKKGDEHKPYWMKVEVGKLARDWETGICYTAKYLGEPGHHHH